MKVLPLIAFSIFLSSCHYSSKVVPQTPPLSKEQKQVIVNFIDGKVKDLDTRLASSFNENDANMKRMLLRDRERVLAQ